MQVQSGPMQQVRVQRMCPCTTSLVGAVPCHREATKSVVRKRRGVHLRGDRKSRLWSRRQTDWNQQHELPPRPVERRLHAIPTRAIPHTSRGVRRSCTKIERAVSTHHSPPKDMESTGEERERKRDTRQRKISPGRTSNNRSSSGVLPVCSHAFDDKDEFRL